MHDIGLASAGPMTRGVPLSPGQVPEATGLSTQQADAIVRVVEASPQLRRRHQFFVWTQGQFQTLLPHVALVCGSYLRQRRDLVFETFNSIVLPASLMRALNETQGPLLRFLATAWTAERARPVMVTVDQLQGAALSEARDRLRELHIHALLVHGVARPQRPAEIESLFVFLTADAASTQCTLAHLDLMVPHLHWSWQRVVAAERELATPTPGTRSASTVSKGVEGKGVTEREKQILSWVREGKSNHEIADILSLSPLTVKNHIQKILRKMGCSNRAQAVAEAIAMGLVPGASVR
jgi:transcriptional regulator EpsA